MSGVGWIAIGLLVAAVLVLVGAEWPRLSERVGADAWAARSRQRRKEKLTLIRGDESDDEFVKSVEQRPRRPPGARRARRPPAALERRLDLRSARMWRNW